MENNYLSDVALGMAKAFNIVGLGHGTLQFVLDYFFKEVNKNV
jgi:hypothetical protein